MTRSQMLQLDRAGGRQLPVFACEPVGTVRGAVIVVHEIFGLNEHIEDIACRFAQQGLVALAPDLFAGTAGLPSDRNDLDAMRSVWQSIPDSQFIADMQAVLKCAGDRFKVQKEQTGAIGYCMGGAIAYMFAGSTPGLGWVADYYGRIYYPQLSDNKPKHPIDYTAGITCPVLGLFSGQDELIPEKQVNELRSKLEDKGIPCEFKIYPDARHAFFNDTREFYNQQAATDAWQRTLDFINRSLNATAGRR